ncbi:aldo/keto reductase [Candidatus Uhrbacteria bacterium]|nr:aldo/keto reductase [Candidatus Uhrbacteria bacterium]
MGSLVLGTAQFGSGYGFSNRRGILDAAQVCELVRVAWECGIRTFDTAQSYGASERLLGQALRTLGVEHEARVITKLDRSVDARNARAVLCACEMSRARLGVSRLNAVLLHREALLDHWDDGVGNALRAAVGAGLVEDIGASVYDPQRALQALDLEGVSALQFPTNILDHRFVSAGVFERAAQRGVTCFIRSVYLQGLLLMDEEVVPTDMAFVRPILATLAHLSASIGVSRHALVLGYIRAAFPNAKVIIGAEDPAQVRVNAQLWDTCTTIDRMQLQHVRVAFMEIDRRVLNPLLWPMYSHLTA